MMADSLKNVYNPRMVRSFIITSKRTKPPGVIRYYERLKGRFFIKKDTDLS